MAKVVVQQWSVRLKCVQRSLTSSIDYDPLVLRDWFFHVAEIHKTFNIPSWRANCAQGLIVPDAVHVEQIN